MNVSFLSYMYKSVRILLDSVNLNAITNSIIEKKKAREIYTNYLIYFTVFKVKRAESAIQLQQSFKTS